MSNKKILGWAHSLGYRSSFIKLVPNPPKKAKKLPLREHSCSSLVEHAQKKNPAWLDAIFLDRPEEKALVVIDWDGEAGKHPAILDNIPGIFERSVSGGLHIYTQVNKSLLHHHNNSRFFHGGQLELFYENRYIAVTGDIIKDTRTCEGDEELFKSIFEPLEKKEMPENARKYKMRDSTPNSDEIEIAEQLLSYLSSDSYNLWWRMPSILKEMVGEDGHKIYHEWCKKSDKYVPEEADAKWNRQEITGFSGRSLLSMVTKEGEPNREARAYVASLGEYAGAGKFKSRTPLEMVDMLDNKPSVNVRDVYIEMCKRDTKDLLTYNELVGMLVPALNREFCLLGDTLVHKTRQGSAGAVRMTKGFPESMTYLKYFPGCTIDKKTDGKVKTLIDMQKAWKNAVDADIRQGVLRFYPGDDSDTVSDEDFNTWRGFAAEKIESTECEYAEKVFVPYIKDCLAVESDEAAQYLMNWLAHLIQKPYVKPKVAVAIRSTTLGVGKSLLADIMREIIGHGHFIETHGANSLTGTHNEELAGKLLVFGDECMFAGDPRIVNSLKTRITEESMTINPKGRDVYSIDSFARYYLVTNEFQAIKAYDDERRYLMLDATNSKHRQDRNFFSRVAVKDENTGKIHKDRVRSLYDWLKKRDISSFHPGDVPQTRALLEQKRTTTIQEHPLQAFLEEVLDNPEEMLEMEYGSSADAKVVDGYLQVDKKSFQSIYDDWNQRLDRRHQQPLNKTTMKRALQNIKYICVKEKIINGRRYWCFKAKKGA